jgi:hypothetical protein
MGRRDGGPAAEPDGGDEGDEKRDSATEHEPLLCSWNAEC